MPFRYCTQCGFKNAYTLNEAKFCAGCGKPLNQAEASSVSNSATTEPAAQQLAQEAAEEVPVISRFEYSVDVGENNQTTIGNLINSKKSSPETNRAMKTSQASKQMTAKEVEAETMRECQSAREKTPNDI